MSTTAYRSSMCFSLLRLLPSEWLSRLLSSLNKSPYVENFNRSPCPAFWEPYESKRARLNHVVSVALRCKPSNVHKQPGCAGAAPNARIAAVID